ncbi:MAG TPA: 50S ribosomal protein L10 [Tepidisphaeraceae bacterium]|nr:50S ribosomal protein L10 [Tepidisphaeraceae bacterium]
MSKKVKSLIEREIGSRLKGVEACAVISPRGVDGIKNNLLRRKLREKGVRMLVVKNTLAKRATAGGKLTGFESLLEGPSAVLFGKESMPALARLLVEEKKTNDKLELRGLFFDGEVYVGEAGVKAASKMPTREEAVAQIVAAILGPGKKLAGALKGPGGVIGGILKTIEEKAPKE